MSEHAFDPDEQSWDELYQGKPQVWSGAPNAQLVAEVSSLPAGTALDLGCGEGADAVWLAEQGWRVTAVDIAAAALKRAAAHAEDRGVSGAIVWLHQDLTTWVPVDEYDLVSAQFFHLPARERDEVIRKAAGAVRSGGTLLVVGHHPDDVHGQQHQSDDPHGLAGLRPHGERLFRPEHVVGCLVPSADHWDIKVSEARTRPSTTADGTLLQRVDTVFRARRR